MTRLAEVSLTNTGLTSSKEIRSFEAFSRTGLGFSKPSTPDKDHCRSTTKIAQADTHDFKGTPRCPSFLSIIYFFSPSPSLFSGIPICSRKANVAFLSLEVVTIVTAKPKTSLRSSSAVSAKIVCSLIPIV